MSKEPINWIYPFAFLAGVYGVNQEVVNSLMIIILLDIITGIAKSGRVYGWRSISSAVLTAGLLSKMLLLIVPLIIAYTGKGIGLELAGLVKGTISVLILSEAYSALGNIQAYRMKKDVPEADFVSLIIKSIRKILLKIINKGIDKIK